MLRDNDTKYYYIAVDIDIQGVRKKYTNFYAWASIK